tara:strand:- start:100 stop:327 length:228 start_codon:yes stop_codon:yes gene_type:complete
MKVIEGGFGKQANATVPQVFSSIYKTEKLEDYTDAFCLAKSADFIVMSSNMEAPDLYFLFDQLKMSILTNGEYEL